MTEQAAVGFHCWSCLISSESGLLRKASRILAVCPPSLGEDWIRSITRRRQRLKMRYATTILDRRKAVISIVATVSVFMVRCVLVLGEKLFGLS
jgi:hypothetical protein